MRDGRKSWKRRLAALVLPGAMALGTSCAESIRESVVSGSLGFIEDSAAALLDSLVPVEDFIGGGE